MDIILAYIACFALLDCKHYNNYPVAIQHSVWVQVSCIVILYLMCSDNYTDQFFRSEMHSRSAPDKTLKMCYHT